MNLFNFDAVSFVGFLMVLVRMSGLMFTMPILGSATIPAQARIGLAAVTSFIVFTVAKLPPVDVSMPLLQFVPLLAGELAVGLAVGFVSQMLFNAVQFAGQMVGFQIGFGIVNVLDPTTNAEVSITSQFLNIVALLTFLTINGHHWLIIAAVRSFELIPVLGFELHSGIVEMIVRLTANVFILAIKFSAPVVVTLLLLHVALGLIARTVPQMNVFIVGFPLQISMGLLMLGISMPIFFLLVRGSLHRLFEDVVGLMKLM